MTPSQAKALLDSMIDRQRRPWSFTDRGREQLRRWLASHRKASGFHRAAEALLTYAVELAEQPVSEQLGEELIAAVNAAKGRPRSALKAAPLKKPGSGRGGRDA